MGPKTNMTGVLIRRCDEDTDVYNGKMKGRSRQKTVMYVSRRVISEETTLPTLRFLASR